MQYKRFAIIIFLTGAITLSLELLASRIMTPYFGVSLFIWTGILSITLLSLAIGYFFGGWIANRAISNDHRLSTLTFYYLAMPAISSLSILVACLLYPSLFFQLAQIGLIAGSFIACIIFLLVPLITLSAMNPLLIALRRESDNDSGSSADSGSGLVFFISTVGSVVGVWVTAFLFIPNISNQISVLMLATALSTITIVGALKLSHLEKPHLTSALLLASIGILSSSIMMFAIQNKSSSGNTIADKSGTWTMEKNYLSFFGDLKVLSLKSTPEAAPIKIYYQDGLIQNVINASGHSLEAATYAMEGLSVHLAQPGDDILILGLAAGIVPRNLSKLGYNVDVVEINPVSLDAAVDHFMFDRQAVTSYQIDARSFIKRCPKKYGVAVVDLFQGDGIPEYLLTREFFNDLKSCLRDDGGIVINSFAVPRQIDPSYHLLKTINAEFEHLKIFHKEFSEPDIVHSFFIVATVQQDLRPLRLRITSGPSSPLHELRKIFQSPRQIDGQKLAQATIITDEHNTFPILNMGPYMTYRRAALSFVPQEFLVN